MTQLPPTCDPQRIDQCLHDSLSDEELAAFESHLESCERCRIALESSAAEPTDWHEARQFLSSQENQLGSAAGQDLESPQNEYVADVLAALAPTDDPHMLGRLGSYEIAGVVGRGGMGVVLKALDPALNRYVAIKVLVPQLATSGAARQRFAREARAAASVVHENVVAIHAVAESGPLPYFVMPYLRGASLQKRLDAHGPLSVAGILRVGIQIATGLAAAHSQGLVHRDIKPANILLEDGVERLKITDFGLARAVDDASLTRTGVIAGTPQFMSPEQARGEAVDSRSDLFSLGSVMYAMCAGRPPFRAETSYGTLQRICQLEPRPIREINADIPEWLAAFIARLHAKNPDDRFQTASEVAQLLEQCLAHLRQPTLIVLPAAVAELETHSVSSPPPRRADRLSNASPGPIRRAASYIKRHRWPALLAAAVVVCVGVWFVVGGGSAPEKSGPDRPTANAALGSDADAPADQNVAGNRPPASDENLERELQQLQIEINQLEARMSALESDSADSNLSTQELKP
jgi:eukaryotic-like serine/threonine-protein kinase